MLSVILASVTNKPFMLSVMLTVIYADLYMLSVIMLNIVECHYAECRGALR